MSRIYATVCGNAAGDVEKKNVNSNGQQRTVANFSVAVNRGSGDNRQTDFVRVTVWGQPAERLDVKKGDLVTVFTNDLRPNAWVNKDGQVQANLECSSNWVEVGQRKPRADQQGQQAPQGQYNAGYNTGYNTGYGQQAPQGYQQAPAQGQAYNSTRAMASRPRPRRATHSLLLLLLPLRAISRPRPRRATRSLPLPRLRLRATRRLRPRRPRLRLPLRDL